MASASPEALGLHGGDGKGCYLSESLGYSKEGGKEKWVLCR